MKNTLLLLVFCFILSITNAAGQGEYTPEPTTPEGRRFESELQREQERARQEASRQRLRNIQNQAYLGTKPRYDPSIPRTIRENRRLVEQSKKMVEPTSAHRQKYQAFLKSDKTGIAIIFPDINCEAPFLSKTVSVENAERCADVPKIHKNGSLYSFKSGKNYINSVSDIKRSQNAQGWWDIHFIDQNFVVGNCCEQGIITDLGNVDFDNLNLTSPGVNHLTSFNAYTTNAQIKQQFELLNKGIKSGDYTYQRTVKAQIGHTYALRSVAYKFKKEKTSETTILSDQIIVFQLAETQSSGSLILLWKNLLNKK